MKFLQKTIPVIFIVMFSYILILLFFFGNIDYINQRNYFSDKFVVDFESLIEKNKLYGMQTILKSKNI